MKQNHLLSVRSVTTMAILGVLVAVLMISEVSLSFITPSFYGTDISEAPILVGTFALGPMAGVAMELVRLMSRSISTGFVGEFANFYVGCSLMLPAGLIYRLDKAKKGAVIEMAAETVTMTVMAVIPSAVVMLPFYFHFTSLDTVIAAGAATNPAISNVWTLITLAVGPFNVLRDVIISLLTALVYKGISAIIHSDSGRWAVKVS